MTHEELLARYADILVHIGINVQPKQEVILQADVSMQDLVHLVVASAYRAGSGKVHVLYKDTKNHALQVAYAHEDALNIDSGWIESAVTDAFEKGAARLALITDAKLIYPQDMSPDLDVDARNATLRKVAMQNTSKLHGLMTSNHSQWSLGAYATPDWAKTVYPDLDPKDALEKLWGDIFMAVHATEEDPVSDWRDHNKNLHDRCATLNKYNFKSLHFMGEGTNLEVGLAAGHIWRGGSKITESGISCNSNIPTEEVFTTPHKDHINGVVKSTKPLFLNGKIIHEITATFKDGRVTEIKSDVHEKMLIDHIDTDDGGRSLGEVALVGYNSAISQTKTVFYNTLFDENAACHIAFGQSYKQCIQQDGEKTPQERGANTSKIHTDWMISNDKTDIWGVCEDGSRILIIKDGDFVL